MKLRRPTAVKLAPEHAGRVRDLLSRQLRASAALIGLLFVAVSIAPEKVFGSDAEAVRQAQALSAFTALANAFFISMASLIPDIKIGIVVTIVAFASAMQTLALLTLVKHWRAQAMVYRGVVLFLWSALVYALELAVGIQLWGCARQQGVAVWAAGADPRGLCDRPGSRVGAARRAAKRLHLDGGRPPTNGDRPETEEVLVDVRPVPVALEDDLAAVAAKHDLNVPPADGLRVAAADRARCGLLHVHRRDRIDLDF